MARAGSLLTLLALLAAQVPWVACESDCQQSVQSALARHACHVPAAHAPAPACGCEDVACEDGEAPRPPGPGEHTAAFSPLAPAGAAVGLKAPLPALATAPAEAATSTGPALAPVAFEFPDAVPRAGPPLGTHPQRLL